MRSQPDQRLSFLRRISKLPDPLAQTGPRKAKGARIAKLRNIFGRELEASGFEGSRRLFSLQNLEKKNSEWAKQTFQSHKIDEELQKRR